PGAAAVVVAGEAEAADGALPALEVAVEQIDADAVLAVERAGQVLAGRVVRFADRRVPVPDVAGRHVDVTGLRPETVERRRLVAGVLPARPHEPAVEDGDAGPHVAQA